MTYESFIEELKLYAEEELKIFQERLIFTSFKILGVRTLALRTLAKKYQSEIKSVIAFPNEYYEVVFIKLCMVSALPYKPFLDYLDECVGLMDNWALCDSFKPKCVRANRTEFLKELERIFNHGGEFYERFVFVMILNYYVEEEYYSLIKYYLKRADKQKYYVHMAVAWLVAEILIKLPPLGEKILKDRLLDAKTHNKAIQRRKRVFVLTKREKSV